MEAKHLTYFKVENFKRFDSLEVNDIAQFNLIVGDNNVGKTTLLEALLFDDEDFYKCLYNFWNSLNWKNIILKEPNFNYLVFFLRNKNLPIKYFFSINGQEKELTIKPKLRLELTKEDTEKFVTQLALNNSAPYFIEFNSNERKDLISLINFKVINNRYVPFISFNILYKNDLIDLFSQISIGTNNLKKFESDLKLFIPNLESIEINSVLTPQQTVIAIREKEKGLIPLPQYGDGTVKLFRSLLELQFCENNRLMIDEVDTGIHYSHMQEYLKTILQNAKDKNVQIFATTHSKECIGFFAKALAELGYQKEGSVIRLADTKKGIKAYTMQFEQFDDAMFFGNEIR